MIPAKIIEISDKVVVEYFLHKITYQETGESQWIPETAEVKNVFRLKSGRIVWSKEGSRHKGLGYILKLDQTVFIKPISEGKCKIVKI